MSSRLIPPKVGAMLAKPAFDEVKKRLDYREYGGAPLLGVDGVVIVGHGRSDAKAIRNGIQVAAQAVAEGLDTIFTDAGFEFRQAGCSMCLAMNPDK